MCKKMETLPVMAFLVVLGVFVQNSQQYPIHDVPQACDLSKPEWFKPCPADEFCNEHYCVPCADICDFESPLMDTCRARCPEMFKALREPDKSKTTSTTIGYKTQNLKTSRQTDAAPKTQASTEDYRRRQMTTIWILVGVIGALIMIMTLVVLFVMVYKEKKPRRPTQRQQQTSASETSAESSVESSAPSSVESSARLLPDSSIESTIVESSI